MDTTIKERIYNKWNTQEGNFYTLEKSTTALLPKTQTYYRSKAFISQIGTNPLTAAGAPLFFLVEKIKQLRASPDIDKLHADLAHELNAFEHQSQTHGYHSNITLAARHILSVWIDETILNTAWGEGNEWSKRTLAGDPLTFTSESETPFSLLLDRCLQNPEPYIDLLELLYLCISLGFEGEYRFDEQGKSKLNNIRDRLFDVIHRQRGEFSRHLEIKSEIKVEQETALTHSTFRPLLTFIVLILAMTGYVLSLASLSSEFTQANGHLHKQFKFVSELHL